MTSVTIRICSFHSLAVGEDMGLEHEIIFLTNKIHRLLCIPLHKTKHPHLLYCSTLMQFWKKLGKSFSVPLKVSSYNIHNSYNTGRFFAPLYFPPLYHSLHSCSETLIYQSHFARWRKALQIYLLETFLENKKSKCLHFIQQIHTL